MSLIFNPQIASLIRSGQNLYGLIQRITPEVNQELDNVAAVSTSLLGQIPHVNAQVTEVADATKKLTALMQSITPRLRYCVNLMTYTDFADCILTNSWFGSQS